MTAADRTRAAELRRRLAERRTKATTSAEDAAPQLTPMLREMWLAETLDTVGSGYTLIRAWRLRGPLDVAALDRSIAQVIARHAAFALRFVPDGGSARPDFSTPAAWTLHSASKPDGADPEVWLNERLSDLSSCRFRLDSGPLFAVHLLHLGPRDAALVWLQHHSIGDEGTWFVIARDLGHFYATAMGQARAPLPDVGAGYRGLLQAPAEAGAAASVPAAEPRSDLPAPADAPWPRTGLERPDPNDPARARLVWDELPLTDLRNVQRAAREIGVSAFALMAAIYQALLARFCDESAVSVGVSRTVRLSTGDDAMVGMFIDHVQLSADAAPGRLLADLAKEIARSIRERPRSAMTPAEGKASGATFVLYGDHATLPDLPGIDVSLCQLHNRSIAVDLHLGVHPTADGASLALTGRVARFDPDVLRRFLRLFRLHLSLIGAAEQPGQIDPWDLPLFLQPTDRQQLLSRAETPCRYQEDQTILQRFQAIVAEQADAPALRARGVRWTYRDLLREATAISDWLRAAGVSPGDVVGIALPRGADLIRATFGALNAGLTIAPIDPDYPETRRADMVAQAGCRVILADERLAGDPLARALPPLRGDDHGKEAPRAAESAPDDIAYVVFTSGSTGRPKGVATTHRAILRLAAGLGPRVPGPGDRMALLASPSFDGCFIEIFGALLNGAELVCPDGDLGDQHDIAALLRDNAVTKGFVTTGLFNLILDTVPGAFAGFDWLAVGGEAMSPGHAMRFLADYPGVDLLNVYGPTENGALTTSHRVQPGDASLVPIGTPLPGNLTLVLGRDGSPVPPGFAGELWVGGPGLALHYVGLKDQTAAVFRTFDRRRLGLPGEGPVRLYATGDRVVQRADGALCYMARRDSQIKLSGFRIEPPEIEAAIRRIRGVQDVMVIPRRAAPGAAVTAIEAGVAGPADLFEANGAALRRQLRQDLPGIMIPSRFCRVQALPLTPNGKRDAAALARLIDREKLDASDATPLAGIDPALLPIWVEFVAPPDAGRDSDFFASGGQSLAAMQLLAEVERRFERRIPISAFFDNPTLGGLNDLLSGTGHGAPRRHLVLIRPGPRDVPPLIAATGLRGASLWARATVDALPPGFGAVYGLNLAADDRGAERVGSLAELARAMADELLSEFPDTPVRLIGYSFAGFLAYVLAAELERRGHPVDRLILIDPNTNLVPPGGRTRPQRDPISTRLSALRAAFRLSPIRGRIDFVFCANSFPKPRMPDAEEWAVLAGGGLSVYRLQTSHSAVIYGGWAKVLARTVSGMIDGTRPADQTLDLALPGQDIARFYAMHDALAAGDTAAALVDCARMIARFPAPPAFLRVLQLRLLAAEPNRAAVRAIARAELRSARPDPAFLVNLAPVLRKLGEARLARRIDRRLFDASGPDVHGAFDLVASCLARRQVWRARWIAHLASRRGRSPLTGLLCKALIARQRGRRGEAYDLLVQAMGRSDISVEHFAIILDQILRPADHAFALNLLDVGDVHFTGNDGLGTRREKWEGFARNAAAATSER